MRVITNIKVTPRPVRTALTRKAHKPPDADEPNQAAAHHALELSFDATYTYASFAVRALL